MATSTTSSGSESGTKTKEKVIATYLPGQGIRGVKRTISAKDAKKALSVDLEDDLSWESANNFRVDVTNVPEALLDVLKRDKDFKVSNES